jgi:hypothetical protein
MVNDTIRWIVRHEKRVWIVITLTFLTGLVLTLPAVEEYSAAATRIADAREKLDEVNRRLDNLPLLKKRFAEKEREVTALEAKAITPKEVEGLHATLQQLIRETGCDMRRLDINEPNARAWMSNDSATHRFSVGDPGHETPFQLVSRTAVLRMEGAMPNVYHFLARVNQLERFIHAKQIRLERSPRNDNVTELEMHVDLYDLVRKKAK